MNWTRPVVSSRSTQTVLCESDQRWSVSDSAAQFCGGKEIGQNCGLRVSNSNATSYKSKDGPSTWTTLHLTSFPEFGLMRWIRWLASNLTGDSSRPPCAFTADVNACTCTVFPSDRVALHDYNNLKTDSLAPAVGRWIRFGHETDPLTSAPMSLFPKCSLGF